MGDREAELGLGPWTGEEGTNGESEDRGPGWGVGVVAGSGTASVRLTTQFSPPWEPSSTGGGSVALN